MTDSSSIDDPLQQRAVPAHDPLTAFFWSSGADGQLRILRCGSCGFYLHPPSTPCPRCLSTALAPSVVSGQGTVEAVTTNVQEWVPGQRPYSIAVVELEEQSGVRLTSNVIGCQPDQVRIGQRVRVWFMHRDGIYYPVFVPDVEQLP
jgi:uncharacterized OB-fold protein